MLTVFLSCVLRLWPCSFPLHFFLCCLGDIYSYTRFEGLFDMSDMERAMEEKKRRGLKDCLTSWKVVLSMIMVQGFVTGMQLLSRVILVQGSFIFSLIAYRHIIAALCVAPFALYFERYICFSFYLLLIPCLLLLNNLLLGFKIF